METIEDLVELFIKGVRDGKWKKAKIPKRDLPEFLILLAREGFRIALDCLDQIEDPRIRNHVKTIILSCAGGALIGSAVGAISTGNAGAAAVGALAGAGVGLIAARVAISIVPDDDPTPSNFVVLAVA